MSKLTAFLAVLLVAALVITGISPWGLPTEKQIYKETELYGSHSAVIENRTFVSRIYMLTSGEVTHVYEEFRNGNEIVSVTSDGTDTYFTRFHKATDTWELMKLSGKTSEKLYEGKIAHGDRISSVSAAGGRIWLTAVSPDEKISVYECTKENAQVLRLVLPNVWPNKSSEAAFDGELLRVTTEDGAKYEITLGGEITHTGEFEEDVRIYINLSSAARRDCKKSMFISVIIAWIALAIILITATLISKKAKRIYTRITAVVSAVILVITLGILAALFFSLAVASSARTGYDTLKIALGPALIVWLGGTLTTALLARRITSPLTGMMKQMSDIADGQVNISDVLPGSDELHKMSESIQELCMSLSIRDYELSSTVKSYHRFIPPRLTELLDRAAIAEVSLGDNSRITGNVGLFSVSNRSSARLTLGDDAYVDFINLSLEIYQSCIRENNGCLLSSGLRLSCLETLFTDSASDGVRAGLDFIGQAQKNRHDAIPAPHPFLLLHRTSFLYGIAGEQASLYPYLSSSELEFLGSFSEKFTEAGVRIVLTEEYHKQLQSSGFTTRYIGFVSDGERNAYKLYEVLDTYPVLERNVRIGYDKRFAEALNLFYRKDFFLARNIFSTLLRACPEDGIVRWYMFACENLFNADKNSEVDFSLFGENEQ